MTIDICADLRTRLRLPVIAAPMFIVSTPRLVLAQCRAGVLGSFPALSARPSTQLDDWLAELTEALTPGNPANEGMMPAPFAVNLIVHHSNDRLDADLALCVKHRVPVVITSLGARPDVMQAIHSYGGVVFHDVIDNRFAHKAVEKGADGLVAVASGAGGHAGMLSPFALVQEIRSWWRGPLALSGSIANGQSILAAEAMGADFAYIGSAFIAAEEANASEAYKHMLTVGSSEDILYTDFFTGVRGNYLKPSIARAGLDPDNLPPALAAAADFGPERVRPWKDIWGAGQGISAIAAVEPVRKMVCRWADEYADARERLGNWAAIRDRAGLASLAS